ncbi:ABC transporter substrate-binding protein [Nitrosococcus wardiae]|uniref:ABC transporter substrate-binding protein n=2 Tax=Nitrosococcus wardiae TaxID=1814290 RepID=A0A4P7C491_9GAMM|nr:ABC transporter substrate-binding protein [Nitrosococcus wardiae]
MVSAAFASLSSVAVIYPEIREPYRSIFLDIIRGIKNELKTPIKSYALEKNYSIEMLKEKLEKEEINVIIALGGRGLLIARELQSLFRVVVGAVLVAPDGTELTGLSLAPDPQIFFQRVKEFTPDVQRITVIYSQEHNGWLIKRAEQTIRQYELELNALPAKSLREAASLYRDVLNKLKSGTDAIWLLQDKTLDEQTILPLILQEAWERNLVVFSSNLSHLKRGVLFALYPDNENMGRSLAELALKQMQNSENIPLGIKPLHNLLVAFNIRTAEHLGLKLTSQMKREFGLIFPLQ